MGSKSDQFIQDLAQFYRSRGSHVNTNPQQFIARINGKTVNLWQLYSYVIECGGSFKVNQTNQWDDIYNKLFNTSITGANISVALRQIYSRFLLPYERAFSSNFGNDLVDDDDDESSFSFFTSSSHLSSSFHHHYQQSHCPQNGTQNDSINPFNKLFCSLLSRLPNELDFALKVSTLLANSHTFDWFSDSKFIDLLIECTPFYCCVCYEEKSDREASGVYLDECADSSEISSNELVRYEPASHKSCHCYQRFWFQKCNNQQVLELVFGIERCTFTELEPQHCETIHRRIKLIGDLIRNLSFGFDNCPDSEHIPLTSGGTTPMLKFLTLLLMCDDPLFNSISLDILSNIATATISVNEDEVYLQLQHYIYRHCVSIVMTSNDVFLLSRSLDIIAKLFSVANEEITNMLTLNLLEYEVFSRISQLLTCQNDIVILLTTLELCLAFSQQNPQLLIKDESKSLIKILLNLLNCEASDHFTSSALKKIKIIDERQQLEIVNAPTNLLCQQNQQQSQVQNPLSQTNTIDNETFALNWLRTTYESATPLQSHTIKMSELFADYVKYCCRNSRKNVIAAQSFSHLIKRCFPACNINNNCTIIEGIVPKTINSTLNKTQSPPTQLASPILKAHLSAPPKNSSPNSTNTVVNNVITTANTTINSSTVTSSTCNASVTLTPTNTSTLIKSLLANKLRSNAIVTTAANMISAVTSTHTSQSYSLTPVMTTATPSTASTVIASVSTPSIVKAQTTSSSTTNITTPLATIVNHTMESSTANPATIIQTPTIVAVTNSIPSCNIITNPTAAMASQPLHTSQQFLLVRTIITSPNQNQSGGTLSTTGTPVRLILPASMLTQQRSNNSGVNGLSPANSPLATVAISTSSSTLSFASSTVSSPTTTSIASPSNTTDLFLKTVLSSGSNSNTVSTPVRSNVKSSPLLNVLLDKGRLPDFTSNSTVITNTSTLSGPTMNATILQQQQPKMFILTTKSPIAIKSLPAIQQTQQTSLQQNCTTLTLQTQQTSLPQNCTTLTLQTQQLPSSSLTIQKSQSKVQEQPKPQLNQNICLKTNGEINSVTNSNINQIIKSPPIINTVANAVHPTNTDLSSIKDIKKTVDDATKLISKRTKEDSNVNNPKKLKSNPIEVVTSTNPSTNSISVSNVTSTTTITNVTSDGPKVLGYECLWHECKKSFSRPSEVFIHVYDKHVFCPNLPNTMACEWGGPEGTGPGCQSKRPKLSLLTHISDFHCNINALQQYALHKQQMSSTGVSSIPVQQPPAHPGYAQNAALLAIRRHATNYVEPLTPPLVTSITPLTVSIRLTAALILRNLAQHSSFVKKTLESFEGYLCELCMSDGRDESRTIAQCLAVIMDKQISP